MRGQAAPLPSRKCDWCTAKPAIVNRPLPGHKSRRLHICRECEKVIARQLHLGIDQREVAVL